MNMKACLVRFYVKHSELETAVRKIKEYLGIDSEQIEDLVPFIESKFGKFCEMEDLMLCELAEVFIKLRNEKTRKLVEKTQRVPADCVLLKSEELSGEIFIRTDQLDGETDWKRRNSHPETQHCSIESIMNIEAETIKFYLINLLICFEVFWKTKIEKKNIELIGIKNKKNENIIQIVQKFAKLMNFKDEIESAWRVGKENNNGKSRPVVVRLTSRTARDRWLKARKHCVDNKQLYGDDTEGPIYMNENAARRTRNLFYLTKDKLKCTYQYIWIQNSRVLIKKNENEKKIHHIKNEEDIEMYQTDINQRVDELRL
ncbi:hypothetical protein ACJJTC_001074 [Scirpophaga incertulas]